MPAIKQYAAASLSDFFQAILDIQLGEKRPKDLPLWYRGQDFDWGYQLIPSLFRGNDMAQFSGNSKRTYSQNHLEEEYRYQHFRAKGSHLLAAQVNNSLEWKELMQHHLVHSRLMDWSESVMPSLQFALEAYLKPDDDLAIQERRRQMAPVIWVLDPYKLNEAVFKKLTQRVGVRYPYIGQALGHLFSRNEYDALGKELNSAKGKQYMQKLTNPNIGTIVCLSAIMELLREKNGWIKEAIIRREINPLFYLLARFYNDGLIVEGCELPPLAIVHPYHSDRIRAQSGVFTVFTHSEMTANEYQQYIASQKTIDPRAMENQVGADSYLYKVRLTRPAQIANELFLAGGRDSRLYPELEYFAKDIEAGAYHF